jgi:multidrug efflux pump subunit AcrB
LRESYRNLLALALAHRRIFVAGFLTVVIASFALVPLLGSNFFPSVDSGEIALHVRPQVGTRIEDASAMFGNIEQEIRKTIPPSENCPRSSIISACRSARLTRSITIQA